MSVSSATPPAAGAPAADPVGEWRRLVDDLRPVDVACYWRDTAVPAIAGWALFAIALGGSWPTAGRLGLLVLAAVLLYRPLAFIHELFHQQAMVSYRHFWHAVSGVPLLLPLLLYLPVHQGHHASRCYGTPEDGEYEQFRGRALTVALRLFGLNLLLPLVLWLRFAVLAPLSLVVPAVRREVIPRFVHLALRTPYQAPPLRGPAAAEAGRVEVVCVLWSWALAGIAAAGHAEVAVAWAFVVVVVATLNTVRALCSTHLYDEQSAGRDALGQVGDSLNVAPGGMLAWALCPAGLQYHALHHLAPYLPYHALPEAHRRILAAAGPGSVYGRATVGSMREGWRRLRDAAAR